MGACTLTLYDHENYGGDKAYYTSTTRGTAFGDRDASGRVTGDCQNTTFLGFEHEETRDNGGVAWLMGEGDNINSFKGLAVSSKCAAGEHRFHKRHDKIHDVVKITIPTENINEGRIREDITVYGKRNNHNPCEWGHFPVIRKTGDGQYSANDSDQWLTGKSYKAKPCPGGDAYWKGHQKVSCVYDVKTGSGLGRIRELHGEIKNTFSGDPRKAMFDKIAEKYCDRADRLNDKITSSSGSDSTCRAFSDAKALAKVYCESGDNIETKSSLCTNESDSLGPTLYNELSENYCKNNPDKEFCKCYNVVNYETVCANRPTSAGCAKAKEAYDKYIKYEIPDPNVWLPCGNFCKGVNNYRPPGHDDGCNGTIAACIQNIEVGAAHDEINAACNIDASSGLSSGDSGGSSGSSGSGGSGSVSTSAVEELKKTIAEDKKKEEEEDKKTNKKLLIGGGGGGIVSSISCIILMVIIVMVMSKKGGGGRRRR